MRTTGAQGVDAPHTLSVKCGGWFEAAATGWGVLMVPVLLLVLLGAAALGLVGLAP